MSPRYVTWLLVAVSLSCASPPPRVLPSASSPDGQHEQAATFRQIRIENGGHRGSVWDLAYSPDGARLYSAGDDKVVRVWDAHTGTLSRVLRIPIGPAHEGKIFSIDVSPDERWVAVASCHGCEGFWTGADAHLFFVLDAKTGRIAGVGQVEAGPTQSVAFSPDGRHLASGGAHGTLCIWSVDPDGRLSLEAELPGHGATIRDIAWYSDSRHLVSAGADALAIVWGIHPAGGWYPQGVLRGHSGSIVAVVVSSDGRRIVTGSRDGSIRIWNADTSDPIAVLEQLRASILDLAISPDGSQLVYAAGDGGPPSERGIGILPLVNDAPRRLFKVSTDTPLAVAWSPVDLRIAHSEVHTGRIAVQRGADLSTERSLEGSGTPIFGVGSAPEILAWSESRDGTWERLNLDSLAIGQTIGREGIAIGIPDPRVRSVTLNAGGLGFVTVEGSLDFHAQVTYMGLATWSLLGGSLLGVGSWEALHLIDLEANEQRACFGHESLVLAVAPYAGGSLVLTGSSDQTVRVWEARSCRERLAFYHDAHGDWAAWTPDGVFTSSRGGELLLGVHQNHGAREAPGFEPVTPEMRRSDLLKSSFSSSPARAGGV